MKKNVFYYVVATKICIKKSDYRTGGGSGDVAGNQTVTKR